MLSQVTNYSFITRHFIMQGNTLQSTGYQLLRQYIYRIISYHLFFFHRSVQDYKIHMDMEIVTYL